VVELVKKMNVGVELNVGVLTKTVQFPSVLVTFHFDESQWASL
jgi:hypothetical protein